MIYESLHEDLQRAIDNAVRELPLRIPEPVQGVEFPSVRDQAREIIAGHIAPVPGQTIGLLKQIRARGWSVAVHNDYRQGGERFTFWLFTHPSGRYLKGEARTDRNAVEQVWVAIQEGEGTDAKLQEIEMATLGWDKINDERVSLIKKEIGPGLTPIETRRLATLQRVADLRIEIVAPEPGPRTAAETDRLDWMIATNCFVVRSRSVISPEQYIVVQGLDRDNVLGSGETPRAAIDDARSK